MKVYSSACAEFLRGRLAVLGTAVSLNKHSRLGGSSRNFFSYVSGLGESQVNEYSRRLVLACRLLSTLVFRWYPARKPWALVCHGSFISIKSLYF